MNTRSFLTAALAMILFASCNNENDAVDNGAASGEDAYIGVTIQLPEGAITKAADGNATTEETALKSLKVYCWQTGAAGGMGAPTEVTISGANVTDKGNNTYLLKVAIPGKVGANNVFVAANTAPNPSLDNAAVSGLASAMADNTAGFAMYSSEIVTVTASKEVTKESIENGTEGANNVNTTLRRVVAKVALTSSLTATDPTTGLADGAGGGMLYDIKWEISRKTNKFFPIIKGTFSDVATVTSPHDAMTDFEANTIPATQVPNNTAAVSIKYTNENAHTGGVFNENNTTAVHVTAVFAPGNEKYVSNVTGSAPTWNIIKGAGAMVQGTTFYTLKTTDGNLTAGTYFNLDGANAYVTAKGSGTLESLFNTYTNGLCHWAIWLHDGTKKYGVLRNHMYSLNIQSIKAPGYPEIPETEDPITEDAWIQVTLDIEAWTKKNMGNVEL